MLKLILRYPQLQVRNGVTYGGGWAIEIENAKGERRVLDSGKSKHHKIERGIAAAKKWEEFFGLEAITEYN